MTSTTRFRRLATRLGPAGARAPVLERKFAKIAVGFGAIERAGELEKASECELCGCGQSDGGAS